MEETTEKKSTLATIGLGVGILLLLCCLCLILAALGGYIFYSSADLETMGGIPTLMAIPNLSEETEETPQMERPAVDESTSETLVTLEDTVVPINDPQDLSCRLEGKCGVPLVVAETAAARIVGEKQEFWVHDLDTNKNNSITASLRYITPHVYFWVEEGVDVDEDEMKALVDDFENNIYPTTREFFGSERSPGIDGDEHIYILYARGLGFSVAGYFSSSDATHPLIQEYSNAHEMFLFNADNTPLGGSYAYSVLAHELQHMIHWNNDLNETSWLNEGSSELAVLLAGYSTGGFDQLYISNPDLQLNDWPNDQNATSPHYGAGFLFMTYFLDRFGEEATQLLIKDEANGMDSVDDVLQQISATDPLTGQVITADDFFLDWVLTNLLLDPSIADGRYVYNIYPSASRTSATESIYTCPQEVLTRTVNQYGADYIAIECAGDYTIHFTGSTITGLLPADPYSGKYAFWSNKGDESDMTLTREFDLTNVNGPIEMTYRTWYDIETDWDYTYVEVSENGETWEILVTPSGTGTDPSGNSYGWGYTGVTQGWQEESVDLSDYAGKKVFIRFEYVTDAAVNGEGFMVDDVRVDAVGYSTDFESDDGGWQAEGFARIQNILPQTFKLALIKTNDSQATIIPIQADQTAQIPLSLGEGETAYLVVTGTTRFTREPASYEIEIK